MRRLIGLLTVVVLLVAGCGGNGSESSSDDKKIVVWVSTDVNMGRTVKLFEQQNPGYTVQLETYPWTPTLHDKILTGLAGGDSPDVALAADQWVGEFALKGGLTAIDDMKEKNGWEDSQFIPNSFEHFVLDGKTYAAPSFWDARGLFIRTDLFQAAGVKPPTTFEDLLAVSKKLTNAPEQFGFADYTGDLLFHTFSWVLYAFGGDYTNSDGDTCTLGDENGLRALAYYKSLYDNNVAPKVESQRADWLQGFKNGYYAILPSGPFMFGLIDQEMPEIKDKYSVVPFPAGDTGYSYGHPNAWIVPENAKNKDGAELFLKFMMGTDGEVQWYKDSGWLPANLDAYEDPAIKANPYVNVLLENAKRGTNSLHNLPNAEAITKAVIAEVTALKDGESPEDAATKACDSIDRLLTS